jgi:hypothetical protein
MVTLIKIEYTDIHLNRRKQMQSTIKNRHEATSWQKKFDQSAPKVGDLAPDFELYDSNGENPVRLSEFRGHKPVALVFGSFT